MSTDINSTQKHQPQCHKKLVASLEECERFDRSESPVKGCLGLIFLLIVLPGIMFWLYMLLTDGGRAAPPRGLAILVVFTGLVVMRNFEVYPWDSSNNCMIRRLTELRYKLVRNSAQGFSQL